MNKNIRQTKPCIFCGACFSTKANRDVYCSLLCRLSAETTQPSGSDCWLWDGAKDKDGYGRLRWKYRMLRAHVASWIAEHGVLPRGTCVLHKCDNPSCINPAHLWIGTVGDNNHDRHIKGRTRWNPKSGDNGRQSQRNKRGQFMCGV